MVVVHCLLILIFAYFTFFTGYFFLFAVAGHLQKTKPYRLQIEPGRFAVLIPSLKNDQVIIETVQTNLRHNYTNFEIIVVADLLLPQTISFLQSLPIRFIYLDPPKMSKPVAINTALQVLENNYDYILILYIDNHLGDGCLSFMNEAFQSDISAIQGNRKAKNSGNALSTLDAVSEAINNHIFRKGQNALGFSASLVGSGMAFRFDAFRVWMSGIENLWEDRELELRILRSGTKIEFIPEAVIYDEKVTSGNVFRHQRAKWLAGQWVYFKKIFFNRELAKVFGSSDLLKKAVEYLIIPKSLAIFLLPLLFIIHHFYVTFLPLSSWYVLLGVFITSLILSIPVNMLNFNLIRACLHLPLTASFMFRSLRKAMFQKDLTYHTPHKHGSDL